MRTVVEIEARYWPHAWRVEPDDIGLDQRLSRLTTLRWSSLTVGWHRRGIGALRAPAGVQEALRLYLIKTLN